MATVRIALANLPFPDSRDDSVRSACDVILQAGARQATVICFPECYVPGYRSPGKEVEPPDAKFLEHAWDEIADAARRANVCVVLGTERVTDAGLVISALVVNSDGTRAGFQEKVQIDPSEESTYVAGHGRRLFRAGRLTFGVAICHEGWRYPETVRWAARRGAEVVFHPHFHEAEPGSHRPVTFGEQANSFHEKALLCRAAENTCYVASVNVVSEGSPTTSVIVNPDGTVHSYSPYGEPGLLVADLDLSLATGLLAQRLRPAEYGDEASD